MPHNSDPKLPKKGSVQKVINLAWIVFNHKICLPFLHKEAGGVWGVHIHHTGLNKLKASFFFFSNLLTVDVSCQETVIVRMGHDLGLDSRRGRRGGASIVVVAVVVVATLHEIVPYPSVVVIIVVVVVIVEHDRRSSTVTAVGNEETVCVCIIIGIITRIRIYWMMTSMMGSHQRHHRHWA